MTKERVDTVYRIKHWFTYHPWLKLIALILAMLIWLYVHGEVSQKGL
jgi:hypothetical protein